MTDQSNEPGGVVINDNSGAISVQPDAPASVRASKGVLGTARAQHGGTLSHEPTPEDVVTVGGMSMQLKTAEQHGFVRRGANGLYEDVEGVSPDASEAKDGKDGGEGSEGDDDAFGIEMESKAADRVEALTSSMVEQGINPVGILGSMIADPEAVPAQIKALAEATGQDEAELHGDFLNAARDMDRALGELVIERGGVSREQVESGEFWNWVSRNISQHKIIGALTEAFFKNDARPYLSLTRQFIAANGSGRGSATKTEKMRWGERGDEVETVVVGGIRTTLEAARRAGLV